MKKADAIRIVVSAAKDYEKFLRDKQFLCASEDGNFYEVAFRAHNFAHFTGLQIKCSSKQFYDRALSGTLSEQQFEFDKGGNARRKLEVLRQLPILFTLPLRCGPFMNSGQYISADYFAGCKPIAIGFRCGERFDIPVTLYNEDIEKLVYSPKKVLAVWAKAIGAANYECLVSSHVDNPEQYLEKFSG